MATPEPIKHPAAGGPPGKPQGGPPADLPGMTSGFEGREEELGKNIALVIKTLGNSFPYQHEMNDALVKALLTMLQFAKNLGKFEELVAHDVATMMPLLERVKGIIEKTGNKELALVALCERTACHYQLVLETKEEPGKRTFNTPFRTVLEASRRLGQFDLTEEEVHNHWTIPRYTTHAAMMGVNVKVSPWNPDGIVTLELVD